MYINLATTLPPIPDDGICATATWNQKGVTVAGGYGWGNGLNQLNFPAGIFVDANQNIYIADTNNARVVKWSKGATYGQIVAGGYGAGSGTAQLYGPMDVVVDKSGAVYITDTVNNRVQKWNRTAQVGETIMMVQRPLGLALDNEESLYVSGSYWSKDILKLRKGQKMDMSLLLIYLKSTFCLYIKTDQFMRLTPTMAEYYELMKQNHSCPLPLVHYRVLVYINYHIHTLLLSID